MYSSGYAWTILDTVEPRRLGRVLCVLSEEATSFGALEVLGPGLYRIRSCQPQIDLYGIMTASLPHFHALCGGCAAHEQVSGK